MRPMQMELLSPGVIAGARLDALRIRTVVMTALTNVFVVDDRSRTRPVWPFPLRSASVNYCIFSLVKKVG